MSAVTPSTAPSTSAPRSQSSLPPSGKGAQILVVDDDTAIAEVVSVMLDAVGLVVTTAKNAEEAEVLLRTQRFHLAVFDWNLPGASGLDLCRMVRSDAELSKLPVLFLTANTSPQDMIDAFASGADDYVTKPFRAPELGARIFSLLRRARMSAAE